MEAAILLRDVDKLGGDYQAALRLKALGDDVDPENEEDDGC